MARTQNTQKAQAKSKAETNHKTAVMIRGILTDVYEGKNNNYITIKVNRDEINPKTKEPYYDNIRVTATPDIELFDDGTEVVINGTIRQYFDSEISRSTMYIVADSVSKIKNKIDFSKINYGKLSDYEDILSDGDVPFER